MNKICTSIEQSKKLIELGIDEDTSDMVYLRSYFEDEGKYNLLVGSYHEGYAEKDDGTLVPVFDEHIPAWSLSALLSVLEHPRCFQGDKPTYWFCGCFCKDKLYHEVEADSPVDACYEMIIKLNELKSCDYDTRRNNTRF